MINSGKQANHQSSFAHSPTVRDYLNVTVRTLQRTALRLNCYPNITYPSYQYINRINLYILKQLLPINYL